MAINEPDLKGMSDPAIIKQIAEYIKYTRLEQNKTQGELAAEAGITRRTLSAFESETKNISLLTLIQLLRALNSLHVLNTFKIERKLSPLQLAKLEQEQRQRARKTKNTDKNQPKSDW